MTVVNIAQQEGRSIAKMIDTALLGPHSAASLTGCAALDTSLIFLKC